MARAEQPRCVDGQFRHFVIARKRGIYAGLDVVFSQNNTSSIFRERPFIKWGVCLLAASLCSCSGLCGATHDASELPSSPATGSAWSFDVVPYLWLAGYDGTFGLPEIPAGVPPTHSDAAFSTHISAVAMLAGQVRYHDFGLFLDGAWLQLHTKGDSASSLYSGTEIKSDIAYLTLALTYRLPLLAKLHTDLMAGARSWHVSNEIDFESASGQGLTVEGSVTWTDPILGAKLQYDLTTHWFGTVVADVGGFGVGSKISWSIFGGVGYRFTNWVSATLGYRYMHVDYDKEGSLMNVNIQGVLVGLGFHF